MGSLAVVTFKTLFTILTCVMAAAFVYGMVIDAFASCFVSHPKWLQVTFADFIVDICIIGAWVTYKESSWILGLLFTGLILCIGSIGTCGYIAMQFFKLSHEESSQDPLYFVLARHKKRDLMGHIKGLSVTTTKVLFIVIGCLLLGCSFYAFILGVIFTGLLYFLGSIDTCGYIAISFFKFSNEESSEDPLDAMGRMRRVSVLTAKVIVTVISCFMLGFSVYALAIDGLPFQSGVVSPCMISSLTDVYIHVVVFSVWLSYKESSWISAFIWILLLVCFRSVAICVYILVQLYYLSPRQHVSLVLFNHNRDLYLSDPLLSLQDKA